ncbi:MAG: phage portal protein [Actinobacteria bacterium]|nr:phage portal protein [Actinomycetota bacterium]
MRLLRRTRAEDRTLSLTELRLQPALTAVPLVTPSEALGNPDVYACVRVLADAAASCPLVVYRRLPDGGRQRASGRTADLLHNPSEGATQAGLVATVMAHLLLHGNAYLGKYRDGEGRVEQLLPLQPDRVRVERRAGRIVFTVTNDLGRPSEHSLDDLIHVKALSTDGLVGLSPIRQMRAALELNDAVREAATALFVNGARPSGILKAQGSLTQAQIEDLRATWSARHGGTRSGGVAVMSGQVEFLPVSMPADDAEFVAARKLSTTEIARCFRVPPWMVAAEDAGSLTYSNAESQMLSFATYSLRPWLTCIEQAIGADRDLFAGSLYAEFLLDALLRADSATRAAVYTQALNPVTGWMRRDEVRRLENLEPEPADVQRPAMTLIPTTNGAAA